MKSYNYSWQSRLLRKTKCAIRRFGNSSDKSLATILFLIVMAFILLKFA